MSSHCQFSLILEGCIQTLVPKAREAARAAGGYLSGDARDGEFAIPTPNGRISGVYRIEGVSCDVCLTEMPSSLSGDAIKRQLMKMQQHLRAAG